MKIGASERGTYSDMWALDQYREAASPGEMYAPAFAQWAAPGSTVLDAGCGHGLGGAALEALGYRVVYLDLLQDAALEGKRFVEACLWSCDDLRKVTNHGRIDYVYCCDVLEHLPTPFVMLAVWHLMAFAKRGAFFSIGLQPDQFGVWVGKSLHQTVQRFDQWRDQLEELARVVEARDLGQAGIYFLENR